MHIDTHGENIMTIANVVCKFYNLPFESISEHTKKQEIFTTRAMIMYLCRDLLIGCPLHIIGYMLNENNPFDHASVSHSCKFMDAALHDKTCMGRWVNPGIRDEYQVVRGNAIYEINRDDNKYKKTGDRISIFVGKDTANRLNSHCKSINMGKSMFIRTAVINELNRIQNGVQV